MGTHSKYSPSSFDRWSECPGSIPLTAAHPEIKEVTSKYAEEGSRLHELAEKFLRAGPHKEVECTRKDWEAIKDYVDHVRQVAKDAGVKGQLFIERRVSLEAVVPEMFGTADSVVYDPSELCLHVIDYKSGAGVSVEIEGNTQLKIYALGALLTFPELKVATVRATIVQPRCFHPDGPVRTETYSALDLVDFWEDVRLAAEATTKPDAPLKSGDHCRWCPVKTVCPELKRAAHEVAKNVFQVIETEPTQDLANLTYALDVIPKLESWIESVREHAYREACAGRPPKGWKLVEKRAHRKWSNESVLPAILEAEFGISPLEMYEKKLRSPAQIEKLIHKSQKQELAEHVVIESTGSTLVKQSDPRPEVVILKPENVFTIINEET